MLLTKLSKKYHLLNREQKLKQIRETSREESENEKSKTVEIIDETGDSSHSIINSSKDRQRKVDQNEHRQIRVDQNEHRQKNVDQNEHRQKNVVQNEHRRKNIDRNEYRPSPEVIVISSTSSETSSENSSDKENVQKEKVDESDKSTIITGMGSQRRTIDSTFDPTLKRTSCAGWKRLESTHVDHLDEVGRRNISLWTDDVSSIDILSNNVLSNDVLSKDVSANDDLSASFETAFTHFVPTPRKVEKKTENRLEVLAENSDEMESSVPNFRRQTSNFGQNKKRLSVLGRNEVILLTSDSDTSSDDEDQEKEKEIVKNSRSNKLNKSKLVQVCHLLIFLSKKL